MHRQATECNDAGQGPALASRHFYAGVLNIAYLPPLLASLQTLWS